MPKLLTSEERAVLQSKLTVAGTASAALPDDYMSLAYALSKIHGAFQNARNNILRRAAIGTWPQPKSESSGQAVFT